MAPKKRKAAQSDGDSAPLLKKGRGRPPNPNPTTLASSSPPKGKSVPPQQTATSSRPKRKSAAIKEATSTVSRKSKTDGVTKPVAKATKAVKTSTVASPVKPKKPAKTASKRKTSQKETRESSISVEIPHVYTTTADAVNEEVEGEEDSQGPSYWLMKAEPESRIEKGKDVKFSIDDLKTAADPEAWDGVRNPSARNNMRAMMKGDLAFFYHSNCKVPGIAGIMEIVEEHSVDESAFDPQHPYYDPKSTRDNPKWCCVKVEYRQKFLEIIKLKELQRFAKEGGVLAKMETLRMARLSVSRVSKKEWDFIVSLVDSDDGAESAAFQPPMVS